MSPTDNLALLTSIGEQIDRLEATARDGKVLFNNSLDAVDATYQRLTTVGAAVARLASDVRRRHPDVPWAAYTGLPTSLMRYDALDSDLLWNFFGRDLPRLKDAVSAELDRLKSSGGRADA